MKVSYNYSDLFSTQKPPVKESFGELPDFDDAFDTVSLRKFYKERESTISQTSYTTQHEDSLFDDLDLDRQNFLATPLSRILSNSNCDTFTTLDPYRKVSYNSTANANIQLPLRDFPILQENNFGAEIQSVPEVNKRVSEGMQILMKNGNMTFNKPVMETVQRHKSEGHQIFNLVRSVSDQRKPQETIPQPTPVVRTQVIKNSEDDGSDFFKMLKAKKIFKIQRDVKSEKVLENLKKKASSPKKSTKSGTGKDLKVIRSQSAHGNNIVFNFSSVTSEQKNTP